MSSIDSARNSHKISTEAIGRLGSPQDEAMLHIESSLSQGADPNTRGVLLNVCRQLISRSGDALVMTEQELIDKLQNKYDPGQISGVINALQSRGLLVLSDDRLKLSNSLLSKLIHSKVQAETANQQKIEAFIANRYEYFLEKGQLLSEQDLNYITPFMQDVVLKPEQQKFIEQSRLAITRQKRRSSMTIAIVIALLSVLSAAAVFFAVDSSRQASVALRQTEKANEQAAYALEQQRLANKRAEEARTAETQAREAEREATQAKLELEQANTQIRGLLSEVTDESNAAKRAQKYAEEQRRVAMDRALEIEKLNKDLKLYAGDKEREAQAARDAEAEATVARNASDALRNILLSRIVAKRSRALRSTDQNLKSYTAMLAYHINEITDHGDVLHPDVFNAVYYAAQARDASAVIPRMEMASGAIGSLDCDHPSSCILGASNGSVMRFEINPSTGTISNPQRLLYLKNDAIRFVFPQTDEQGVVKTAFVLGALDQIIEILLPVSRDAVATEIRRIPLPDKLFVKEAIRTTEDVLMIQTTDGALYTFDCTSGDLAVVLSAEDGAIAWTALATPGLICFATVENALILSNSKGDQRIVYAHAKKRVSQMQLKQYGTVIYLTLAYEDGELEVFLSNTDAFLDAYANQRTGKSYYQIQSLRASVHTGFIPTIAFADSRPMMAVGSYDGTVSVWDLQKWEASRGDYQPLILDDHDDWVTTCTFLPGDNTLLSGSKLGTVKFWYLDPSAYSSVLCTGRQWQPSDEEWREYIGDELINFKNSVCRQ